MKGLLQQQAYVVSLFFAFHSAAGQAEETTCWFKSKQAKRVLGGLPEIDWTNRSADLPLHCNSWGYCADPQRDLTVSCSQVTAIQYTTIEYNKIERRSIPSPFGWLGVQKGFLLTDCQSAELEECPAASQTYVYNMVYVFIVLTVIMNAIAVILLIGLALSAVRRCRSPWKILKSMCRWLADMWVEFPGLLGTLPAELHEVALQRVEEKRNSRFRLYLGHAGIFGPPAIMSVMLQWFVPGIQRVNCTTYLQECQVRNLAFQREHCMTFSTSGILAMFGLYSIVRPDFVTKRSISVMTTLAHLTMLWHLLEVQSIQSYDEWFGLIYLVTRFALAICSGNLRLNIVLNICHCFCLIVKHHDLHSRLVASHFRFTIFATVAMFVVVTGFEYSAMRETVLSILAERAVAEAANGRSVLDMLCDAVVVLRDMVIAEACPKLEALLLRAPSPTGMASRPFLDCIIEEDRDRIRERIDSSAQMNEAAFVIHTQLGSSGSGSNRVDVQLCVSCFDDSQGNKCHMVGVREEGMLEAGRIDNLPSQWALSENVASGLRGTAFLTPGGGAATEVSMEQPAKSVAMSAGGASSVDSGSCVEARTEAYDMIVDTPEDEPEGASSLWLDCTAADQYIVRKISKSLVYQLGPSLGVEDFTELFISEADRYRFAIWMDKTLKGEEVPKEKALRLRLRHWREGLFIQVKAQAVGSFDAFPSDAVVRLQLSGFSFKLRKLKPFDSEMLPLYAKSQLHRTNLLGDEDDAGEEARGSNGGVGAPRQKKRTDTASSREAAHEAAAPTLAVSWGGGSASSRTADYSVTPHSTRSLMVLDLIRHWHVEGHESQTCCDLHGRAEALRLAMLELFQLQCAEDQELKQAWQCKTCSCLYATCPPVCRICTSITQATSNDDREVERRNRKKTKPRRSSRALLRL
eukprot:TRINITY_DN13739_c0_g1_i3.p1 TRINITY_DN13739_c0_g1~~TRINITY_DN13739_c0_g1_i3.p1  ORF type:complete len:935 (+),score=111.38 TRINITY_DN13739_c0_g1_i3:57-2807(+)